MDVVAPKRDRARERLRKLDLVMLAVTINMNDGPFAAFGQDAALALDGMPESHDAEFRNLECIVHYSANPLLADFICRGETKSMGERRAAVSGFLPAETRRTALTRIQEDRLEDRSSIPQTLNFPSTWPPPALCGHPHSSAGAYRIASIAGIMYSRRRGCRWASGRQRLEAGVEAHAFHAVHRHVAEQRALQPPKLWNAIGTAMGTRAKRKPASRLRGASSPVAAPAICSTAAAASIPSPERTLENQVKTAPLVSTCWLGEDFF
jgi:hypothetical protein